ncbi:MAG: substrate-binding domain-containing protein, partial [Steroidobacter sp.]
MKKRLAALALATVALVGCGKKDGAESSTPRMGRDTPVVRIDGSSTVFPIAEAVAEEFQLEQRGAIRVTAGLSGTGGGFKKLCRGDIDISNASRPILTEEIEMCRKAGINFIELPVAFDAITVVVNPKNDWV